MALLVCEVEAGALGALNAVEAVWDGVKTGIDGLETVSVLLVDVFVSVEVSFELGFKILNILAWSSACCKAIDCGSLL